MVTNFTDDVIEEGEVFISMWREGFNSYRPTWKFKLQHIWQIIKRGHPYEDCIILSAKQAVLLGEHLLNLEWKANDQVDK